AGKSDVVFDEPNERLELRIRRSDSGSWLFLDVGATSEFSGNPQKAAVEVWCLPADRPSGDWRRIVTRGSGVEVFAEHWQDNFLFRTNDVGPNWRLVRAPIEDPSPSRWEEIVPNRAGVTLEQAYVLERHLVLVEREGLLPRLMSLDQSGRIQAR